jgi:hypothetical protein
VASGQIGGQALMLGLIDQVVVNQVPVDFGSGRPFFATGGLAEPLRLENPTTIARGDRVTHLVYDVSRRGPPSSAFRLAGPLATDCRVEAEVVARAVPALYLHGAARNKLGGATMEADAARAGGRLAGLTALVTGAGSGIGQAIAHLFAAQGAAILAAGRREQPVAATAAAIHEAGGVAAAAPVDVADEAAVIALLERLPALLGPRLDVLVNAAGTGSTTTAPDTPLEVWERVFAVNARGTFLMSKHALPLLRMSQGAIVNVGSIAGIVDLRNRAAYCASKAPSRR